MSTFGRLHTATQLRRELLTEGWQCCSTEANAIRSPTHLALASLDWLQTTVPNTAASTLRQAQRWSLDSPARNFDAEDWWFRLSFSASPAKEGEITVLHFDGLATVADVWLNGELLIHSENMFRTHSVDVTLRLQPDNELLIRFLALDTLLALKRPRPRWKVPMIQHQQLRWLRTTLLGRTPGWSPPAAAVGPWREIWLERQQLIRIHSPQLRTTLQDSAGHLEFTCMIESLREKTRILHSELSLTHDSQRITAPLFLEGEQIIQGSLTLEQPTLWWPHTHGEPALYKVEMRVMVEHQGLEQSIDLDLGSTGFRKITLDTTDGSFAIAVNDVPVFCRGACWTPPDVVALNSLPEQLERSIYLIREAGMNMLRVGGTMVYETDEFLNLCDANGILLWQDLMFANMDYPETDDFIAEVTTEISEQVRRLSGHPCLTMLCGNSEGEQQAAMFGATRDRWSPALFHRMIPTLLGKLCPDIPYWPSSAHGGSFPHQNNVGTTSYYGVGAYMRPLEDARRSEVSFATECLAFANVPEDSCIEKMPSGLALKVHHPQWKARTPRDLGAGWDFEDVRDYYLKLLYDIDPLTLRYANHDRYLELSRIVTGEVMAATFAEWRRKASHCNGALIWFLQDLVSGAGWGIIDDNMTPKAPYYYLKRVLQPVMIGISDEGCNGLYVHVVNDRAIPLEATLEIAFYRANGNLVTRLTHQMTAPPHSTDTIPVVQFMDYFSDTNHTYRFGSIAHNCVIATLRDINKGYLTEAYYFLTRPDLHSLGDIGLTAHAKLQANGDAILILKSDQFARSVRIESKAFSASDQYFELPPQTERRIILRRAAGQLTVNGIVRALNCRTPIEIEFS